MKLKTKTHRKFLKDTNNIKSDFFFEDIENKVINIDPTVAYVSSEDMSMYDYTGNLILYYTVNEMSNLLDINDDKFIKGTLAYLLVDVIIRLFDENDLEKEFTNTETKRFQYALTIVNERDVENISGGTEGFYGESIDPDKDSKNTEINEEDAEQQIDMDEENDALDMEDEMEFDNIDFDV